MIDYQQAVDLVRAHSRGCSAERIPITCAGGRVLAAPLVATGDLPPFDNSAMDGYAVAAGESGLPAGSELPIAGVVPAGAPWEGGEAAAVEIMTGAALPPIFDAVIAIEKTRRFECDGQPMLRTSTVVRSGLNVRLRGEDVRAGERLLAPGTVLDVPAQTLCAALGVATLSVARKPKVAVLCTGRELVDDPSQALQPGQIRNSNGAFLRLQAERAGIEVVHRAQVGDDADALIREIDSARTAGADIVISTGAVSMGRYDFIPDALRQLQAELLFHKVQIRPGKPILLARLPDGTLYFGLPGNPVSAAVGLRFFVEPAVRQMLGLPPEQPLHLPLRHHYVTPEGLRVLAKGRAALNADGVLDAEVLPGQQSFRLKPLLDTNAWLVLDEHTTQWPAGARVATYSLGHLLPLRLPASVDLPQAGGDR